MKRRLLGRAAPESEGGADDSAGAAIVVPGLMAHGGAQEPTRLCSLCFAP